jgi:hypothetical protein
MAGKMLKRVLTDRIGGKRPSVPRTIAAAATVGAAAAGITYKVLRS